MRAVLIGRQADELIERRHRLGQDRYDEVWDGEYHLAPEAHGYHGLTTYRLIARIEPAARARGLLVGPSLNIGTPGNYRVPDLAVHRTSVLDVWNPTAALVGEVLPPDDETWQKFDFYRAHQVSEILVADYAQRSVRLFRAIAAEMIDAPYREVSASEVLGLTAADIADIDWP
jgi:Putative restriction endonuclease